MGTTRGQPHRAASRCLTKWNGTPIMITKNKWVVVGAASVLGVGLLSGGAVAAANAMSIQDADGSKAGISSIETFENLPVTVPETSNPAPTPTTTPSTGPTGSTSSSSNGDVNSANTPNTVNTPNTPNSPNTVNTPNTPNSPNTPNTPNTPASPASPASPVSAQTPNSPQSVD